MTNRSFFLGGCDLEMRTIRRLLETDGRYTCHDQQLPWGARASAYREPLLAALDDPDRMIVLVELPDDLGLVDGPHADRVIVVDHHNERAGVEAPSALRQVFDLLELPANAWTREFELVEANDRAHVRGLLAAGATPEEIRRIRAEDRAAQGITPGQEAEGLAALHSASLRYNGRLAVIDLPHGRAATVTDPNEPLLGGPGYANLLIRCPDETLFFGDGRAINGLRLQCPGGWWGGAMPERGFWGCTPPAHDQVLEALEIPMTTQPASEIPVRVYHNILVWPLLLRGEPDGSGRKETPLLQAWVDEFRKAGWTDRTDETLAADDDRDNGFTYEQIVYFHPFVRDFVFGDGITEPKDRSLHRLTRNDFQQIQVTLGQWDSRHSQWADPVDLTFQVERTELFLGKPCVALLVVEVSNGLREAGQPFDSEKCSPYPLDQLQNFQDQFRRIYPPFWWDRDKGPEACAAGLCLRKLEWIRTPVSGRSDSRSDVPAPNDAPAPEADSAGHPEPLALDSPAKSFEAFTGAGAEPPVFDHWQVFFGDRIRPFQSARDADPKSCRLSYQQVMDERMPAMSYFAVDDPLQISPGDCDRLTFFDAAGTDPYPYHKPFLDERRSRSTYDRFFHYGTRYVCSGYGFAVIGTADGPDGFFQQTIRTHFRRHYFLMGLIAHFQRAALLYFADELSSAKKGTPGKSSQEELHDPEFRRRVEDIQMQFLKFRTRAYFPEVTNQLQGRELFQLWFDQLDTDRLFQLVDGSSQRLYDLLSESESRQLTRTAEIGLVWTVALTLTAVLLTCSTARLDTPLASVPIGWLILTVFPLVFLLWWGFVRRQWRIRFCQWLEQQFRRVTCRWFRRSQRTAIPNRSDSSHS